MRRLMLTLALEVALAHGCLAELHGAPLIANPHGRTTQSLNGEWHYIVDPYENGISAHYFEDRQGTKETALIEYDFEASPTLRVPGDWNSQRDALFFYEGPIWYEKRFRYKKQQRKRVFLHFGGANYRARVYLNAKKLGEHEGGFTPFDFEVTDGVGEGENSLVVEVDNTRGPETVPAMSTDWWNYGGLTRDVMLIELPETYIENYFVQLQKGSLNEIAGWVQINGREPAQRVAIEIPSAGIRQQVATDSTGHGVFHFSAKLENWSPGNPKLYRVMLSTAADQVEDSIGFRAIETRGREILLNEKPIFLRGISIHEEAAMRGGRAFSEEDDRTLLKWAKELGCNFVRLAHYPHNESMARLADQMGLLVWEEIPVYWGIAWESASTLQSAEAQMDGLIARDQNRAAVILWSLSNETPEGGARLEFLRELAEHTRSLDSTRLVTSAMNSTERTGPQSQSLNDALGECLDVLGLNEYLGWYWGKPDDADKMHWTTRYEKPLIVSEFGGEGVAGRHGEAEERWTEESQADLYVHQIRMLDRISGLAGMSPWLLVDYRSPRRQLPGIQDYYNRKGLISNQGQKKLAFFELQKYYAEKAAAK
jgi:beta-glucuronidase